MTKRGGRRVQYPQLLELQDPSLPMPPVMAGICGETVPADGSSPVALWLKWKKAEAPGSQIL